MALVVAVSGLFVRTCFGGGDPEIQRLKGALADSAALVDSLRKEVSAGDSERDSVLALLAARDDSVVTLIDTVVVQSERAATVRDSSMSSLVDALRTDAPHLVEPALSVQRSIERTDSLHEQHVTALEQRLFIRTEERDRWKNAFDLERQFRQAIEGELAAERALRSRLESNLRRAKWEKRIGGVAFVAAVAYAIVK